MFRDLVKLRVRPLYGRARLLIGSRPAPCVHASSLLACAARGRNVFRSLAKFTRILPGTRAHPGVRPLLRRGDDADAVKIWGSEELANVKLQAT